MEDRIKPKSKRQRRANSETVRDSLTVNFRRENRIGSVEWCTEDSEHSTCRPCDNNVLVLDLLQLRNKSLSPYENVVPVSPHNGSPRSSVLSDHNVFSSDFYSTCTEFEQLPPVAPLRYSFQVRKQRQLQIMRQAYQALEQVISEIEDCNPGSSINMYLDQICSKINEGKVCNSHEQLEYELHVWQETESEVTKDVMDMFQTPQLQQSRNTQMFEKKPINIRFSVAALELNSLGTLQFDVFALDDQSMENPLSYALTYLFHKHHIDDYLKIESSLFTRFICKVEDDYKDPQETPYHNRLHAAETVSLVYWILNSEFCSSCDMAEFVALLVGAAIHDVGHRGRTNDFMKRTGQEYAITYNDQAIMENYHLAHTFRLLKLSKYNIFKNLDDEERRKMRDSIIHYVMHTDMSHHKVTCSKLSKLRGTDFYKREEVYSTILHAADIGSCALPWDLSFHFSEMIIEEFHQEGDELKELGYECLPLFNRATFEGPTQSQLAFINYVVHPLFHILSFWIPEIEEALRNLDENRQKWEQLEDIQEYEMNETQEKSLIHNTELNHITRRSCRPVDVKRKLVEMQEKFEYLHMSSTFHKDFSSPRLPSQVITSKRASDVILDAKKLPSTSTSSSPRLSLANMMRSNDILEAHRRRTVAPQSGNSELNLKRKIK